MGYETLINIFRSVHPVPRTDRAFLICLFNKYEGAKSLECPQPAEMVQVGNTRRKMIFDYQLVIITALTNLLNIYRLVTLTPSAS